jgi:hypothetical protein
MHGIARISFTGGARLMPARNGYDRELVFEEAECCARRHGLVRLELGSAAITIRRAETPAQPCGGCGQLVDRLDFALGTRHLCQRCARHSAR